MAVRSKLILVWAVLLLVAGVAAVAAAGLFFVFTKLDYQALNLASLFVPALLPILAILIALLAYGPLAGVRERMPMRGVLAAVGVALAALLPVIALRGAPSRISSS